MKQAFIFFILWGMGYFPIQAQVMISCLEAPERGALLEIRTNDNPDTYSDKGVLIPRVMLEAYNSLKPLYDDPVSTPEETVKAMGMMVYNLNPDAQGIRTGIVEWNGRKWVTPGEKTNLSAFTVVEVVANGFYNRDRVLLPYYNTLSVKVNVSLPGTYTIQMVAKEGISDTNAGFSFFSSGEFTNTGEFLITLHGEGKPLKSYDQISGKKDALIPILNGKEGTLITSESGQNGIVKVDGKEAKFSFACPSSAQNFIGTLTAGSAYTELNERTVLLNINATEAGGEYVIESLETVNGIRLEGRGTLEGNSQTISIYLVGTPTLTGNFTLVFHTNSSTSTTRCEVNITVN